MTRKTSLLAVSLIVMFGAAACGGGGSTMKADTTTTGQELMDLKKALDAGVINQKEYEKQREKILKGQ
jgi:ABC-type glycerol-3-phosphate transport system substrate-binding protein